MIFEIVFINNGEQGSNDTYNRKGVQVKSPSPVLQPLVLQCEIFGAIGLYIKYEREQGRNKRSDNEEVAEVADEVVHGWAL
jgi:hypothetical protein